MPILGNLKSNQHDSTVQRRQGGGIFRERSGRSEKKHASKWKEERMVYRETKNNYISKKGSRVFDLRFDTVYKILE